MVENYSGKSRATNFGFYTCTPTYTHVGMPMFLLPCSFLATNRGNGLWSSQAVGRQSIFFVLKVHTNLYCFTGKNTKIKRREKRANLPLLPPRHKHTLICLRIPQSILTHVVSAHSSPAAKRENKGCVFWSPLLLLLLRRQSGSMWRVHWTVKRHPEDSPCPFNQEMTFMYYHENHGWKSFWYECNLDGKTLRQEKKNGWNLVKSASLCWPLILLNWTFQKGNRAAMNSLAPEKTAPDTFCNCKWLWEKHGDCNKVAHNRTTSWFWKSVWGAKCLLWSLITLPENLRHPVGISWPVIF